MTIILCDGANNACCGDNGACCSDPDKLFKLPYFTDLKHPGENATDGGGKPTIVTVTVSGTGNDKDAPTPTSPAVSGGSPSTTSDASVAAANSDQAMKVGLGVGIPLGVLLLAACGYLAWELRKKRQAMAVAGAGGDGGMPKGPYFEADSSNMAGADAGSRNLGIMSAPTDQGPQSQSPAPKYQPYSHTQQAWPAAELPELGDMVAHQLPGDGTGR